MTRGGTFFSHFYGEGGGEGGGGQKGGATDLLFHFQCVCVCVGGEYAGHYAYILSEEALALIP